MRPLKLTLEGFTSYRRPVEVDFQDLDLFAITGPTGAGKSSLVLAMTYALYGRVPGFGNEVKELISQGSDHLQVTFEFAADGQRYVVTRRTARRGAPHVRLFRIGEDGTSEGLTDRARETEEKVRALVGLDFEGFTRSVLLPQGQFHLFLAGQPGERRKVLSDLLRLDIYEAIMRAANGEAADCEQKATGLRRRLTEDFADANLAALADRKKRLQEIESLALELSTLRDAIQKGRNLAADLSSAQARLSDARTQLESDEGALAGALSIVESGGEQMRSLDSKLADVENGLAASPFRPELHQRLRLALTPAREYEQAHHILERLHAQEGAQEKAVRQAKSTEDRTEEAAAQAREAWQQAETDLEELRLRHAAADLRRGLKPGDACPVCNQSVALVPLAEHVVLDEAVAQHKQARAAAEAANRAAEKARREAALAQQRLDTLRRQLEEAREASDRWRRELLTSLALDQVPSRSEIEASWQTQEQARQQYELLQQQHSELRERRDEMRTAFEKARREMEGLQAKVDAQRSQVLQLEAEALQAGEALARLAREHGWQDMLAALDRREESTALERRAAAVDMEMNSIQQEIGAVSTDVERIQAGIKQAAQLRREESELTARGRLARELAGLLRADRFQAYVEGAALRVLAEDGSRHLAEISRGRYEFEVQGQEFLVIDHRNGDQTRSVRTLSGGETFLASLALALALAERLPELGALGTGTALECLFLDEGFSSLDAETREVAAGALERLHLDGTRMVGVITHDRELAERMPCQITVVKSEAGSTVSTE